MTQVKRGLRQNIPNPLSQGEFGWCADAKEFYMGAGTLKGIKFDALKTWTWGSAAKTRSRV